MGDFEEKIIENEKSNFKMMIIPLIVTLVLGIIMFTHVGYAYEVDQKELNTANVNGKLELVFENAQIMNEMGIESNTASIQVSENMKKLKVNAGTLRYPGAKVEYKVDIANYSTVEVKVESIECEGLANLKAIKLEGIKELNENIVLKPGEKYNLKFTIKWDEEYNEAINETANFNIDVNFIQNID